MKITMGKSTAVAEEVELPKVMSILKPLKAHRIAARWDKEANTVEIVVEDAPFDMQFEIIGKLNAAILADTGAKKVLVQGGTQYTPNNLTILGTLE